MLSKTYRLRCYAYRAPDGWYADCLDLMLLTKRETLQGAMQALEEQVLLYVESVTEHGDEQQAIPRPAPPTDWLRFQWRQVLHTLRILFRNRNYGFVAYEVTVPAGEARLVYA